MLTECKGPFSISDVYVSLSLYEAIHSTYLTSTGIWGRGPHPFPSIPVVYVHDVRRYGVITRIANYKRRQ